MDTPPDSRRAPAPHPPRWTATHAPVPWTPPTEPEPAIPFQAAWSLPANVAWDTLPDEEWNDATADHLCRRLGWTATPEQVAKAREDGPLLTVRKALALGEPQPQPEGSAAYAAALADYEANRQGMEPAARQAAQQAVDAQGRRLLLGLFFEWLRHARQPANSAQEKWVLFLADVFVSGAPKVDDPLELHRHYEILRTHALGPFGDLCKAVVRSPAMIRYLDLQQNRKGTPNENFARELFELFMLGEGNYTEEDIREAARALTGYQVEGLEAKFVSSRHDSGDKTIFGQTGPWQADDVVDLALAQPAAATFLPRQLLHFYLSTDHPVPPGHVEELGQRWREADMRLDSLLEIVCTSRSFYQPAFLGSLVQSPIQYHLGLLQALELDVAPFPSSLRANHRLQGQYVFEPPNVRGWLHGRTWISSSRLAARRQLVEGLFAAVDESKLNGDDLGRLQAARGRGEDRLSLTGEHLQAWADLSNAELVARIASLFPPAAFPEAYRELLLTELANATGSRTASVSDLLLTVLQTPTIHLC